MHPGRVLACVVFLGLAVFVATGAAAVDLQPTPDPDVLEPELIELDVAVESDGTAVWTVTYQFAMSDAEAQAAFESLAAAVAANTSTYRDHFAAELAPVVTAATENTDREMAVENITVDTEVQNDETGKLVYRFEWTDFAVVDGEDLHIGDAIAGGPLPAETELTISWAEQYRLDAVTPTPTVEGPTAVAWQGTDTTFGADEPRVIATADIDSPVAGLGWPYLVGGAVLIAAVFIVTIHGVLAIAGAVLATAAAQDRDGPPRDTAPEATTDTPEDTHEEATTVDEQLEELLAANNGRLTQAQLTAALDHSPKQVESALTELATAGTIDTAEVGETTFVVLVDPPED